MLVGLSNHDNVGAIFRNAAAFGADAVLLDAGLLRSALPQGDPRLGRRGAQGALRHCAGCVGTIAALLDRQGFEQIALSPGGTADIRDAARPDRVALYLGTEGDGLPEALMSRLRTVRIGMAPGFDSLNVAAASAIALHHFSQSG